jgi:hypothetical protein
VVTDADKLALSLIYEWAIDQRHEQVIDALIAENPEVDQWHRTGSHAADLRDRERLFALEAMSEEEFAHEDTARMVKAAGLLHELSQGEANGADLDLALRTEHVLQVLRARDADDNLIDWGLATKAMSAAFPKPDGFEPTREAEPGQIPPPVETDKISCRRKKLQALIDATSLGKRNELDSFVALHPPTQLYGVFRQTVERTLELWRSRKPPCKLLQIVYNLQPQVCADEGVALVAGPSAAPTPAAAGAAPASATRGERTAAAARSSPIRQALPEEEAEQPAPTTAAPATCAEAPIDAAQPQHTPHGERAAVGSPGGAQAEARARPASTRAIDLAGAALDANMAGDSLEESLESLEELSEAPNVSLPKPVRSVPALQPSGRAGGSGVGVANVTAAGKDQASRKRKAFTDEEVGVRSCD